MRPRILTIALTTVVGALVALASTASATVSPATAKPQVAAAPAAATTPQVSGRIYRPFPEGINPADAKAAWQQVTGRAQWDPTYAGVIAREAGRPQFNKAEYRPKGYASSAETGTTNSGLDEAGRVVPVRDHGGSQHVRVLLVVNVVTQRTVQLMVRCGNPRLHPQPGVKVLPWKPFATGTVVRAERTAVKPIRIACPSGQVVFGKVRATVSAVARARTWGQVRGSLQLKLRLRLQAAAKVEVDLRCGPGPKKPRPTRPSTVTVVATATAEASASAVATCPDGTSARASAWAQATAQATATTVAKAKAKALAKARKLAQAKAKAKARAEVFCGKTPPPPPPVTPPPPPVTPPPPPVTPPPPPPPCTKDCGTEPKGENSSPAPPADQGPLLPNTDDSSSGHSDGEGTPPDPPQGG